MSINGLGNPQANQELAQIANAGQILQLAPTKEISKPKGTENEKRTEKESLLKRLISGKDNGIDLQETLHRISTFMSSDMSNGKDQRVDSKTADELQEDMERILDQRESSMDEVEIGAAGLRLSHVKGRKQGFSGFGGGQPDNPEAQREEQLKTTFDEYQKAYSKYLMKGGNELSSELDRLTSVLMKLGVTHGDMLDLRKALATRVRQQIAHKVKQAFLAQVTAEPKSVDYFVKNQGVMSIIGFVMENDRLGGWEFGGYREHIKGTSEHVSFQVGEQLSSVAREAIDRAVTEQALHMDKPEKEMKHVEKQIGDWFRIGKHYGVDFDSYMTMLPLKMDDLGLLPRTDLPAPQSILAGGGAQTNSGDPNSREREFFVAADDERKEVLFDRLRAETLKNIMDPGWGKRLALSFRMIQTKNGLLKLGVRTDEIERVEQEGKELAKWKLAELLRDQFEERGTISDLSSPAGELVEKKIRSTVANLEKLGSKPTQEQLTLICDNANRKMFEIMRVELSEIQQGIRVHEIPYLRQREKIALAVLDRVTQESRIDWQAAKRLVTT